MKILLLEDDRSLGQSLLEGLSGEFEVSWARSVQEFQRLLKSQGPPDLFLLDVNLPDGNGFDLAVELAKTNVPLIFLTAEGDAESRLRGYELGAQEYIPKPFHLKELRLRIEHVLFAHRRAVKITLDDLEIDLQALAIRRKQGGLEYPPSSDMKVLKALIERSPEPVSRDELMDHIWGKDSTPSQRTIDNSIVRIKKLLGPANERCLRSVRGVGYQWTLKENNHGE